VLWCVRKAKLNSSMVLNRLSFFTLSTGCENWDMMADATLAASQQCRPLPNASNAQQVDRLDVPDNDLSPSSDSGGEDEPLYRNQDDALSIIQPALSPVATRLTSPKTPAAEKAAAMELTVAGSYFPRAKKGGGGLSLGQVPPPAPESVALPSPWHAGPKELVVRSPPGTRPAIAGVFDQTRHRRASSSGSDTFKKIRDALPSLALPSNFLSNFSTPSFFETSAPKHRPLRSLTQIDGGFESAPSRTTSPAPSDDSRLLPGTPARPRPVPRTKSDESLLYHSLSNVSSLGDDDRWTEVREQTNSRIKAIKDSWDMPVFKLPQLPNLPNFLSSPLVRNFTSTSQSPDLKSSGEVPSLPPPATAKDGSQSEFDRVLATLTGDIVLLGGYRGSILRSRKTGRQVWVPVKVGLNIRKVNLEVGLDPEDEERMEETMYPSGMLKHIGPVDIAKRLYKRLRDCDNAKAGKLRVWEYGWDWRLSPHIESKKLVSFLESLPSNQGVHGAGRGATVLCHSLGGLITRHAVNQRPELFAGVVYVGTPQRCINILGPFRNGDVVLLNEKVLTAQVNFSMRTSFVFLPEDGYCFINRHTGEEFPVDFYNPDEWAKYALSPCVGTIQPAYNSRQSYLGSLLNLSGSIPNLPTRSRVNSAPSEARHIPSPARRSTTTDTTHHADVSQPDRSLAPQMGNMAGETKASQQQQQQRPHNKGETDKYMTYLNRTLRETKQFRSEMTHRRELTAKNLYPPLAVIYGKDIPTVYGAHVSSREAIVCADAYDNLVFGSGDGVVLAREAMLPEGYSYVKGGRVCTDKGHVSMLGDLQAVARALEAVRRGRRKGIGLGLGEEK
jgi:pimeloyl-ACP methyl ester carboxylesterase